MVGKFLVDSLGIKSLLMLANKILPHVSLENGFKHRVHELLLLSKQVFVISRSRTVLRVKDLFTAMGPGCGNGSTTPGIPLFLILENHIMGLVPLDSTLEFLGRCEPRRFAMTVMACRGNIGEGCKAQTVTDPE